MSNIEVTAAISTKNRYHTTLPMAILSIAQQTYKPKKLLIFDDGEHRDLREDSVYKHLFDLLTNKGIEWAFLFGKRKGQVLNHQAAIDISDTEWIWRVDDDDAPEADVLERLVSHVSDDVGGVAGLILAPDTKQYLTSFASGKIEDIFLRPNVQWFRFEKPMEVDHFNNSFLFRKSAAVKSGGYCMELSPVGHREETIFTYGIKKAGYKLIVDPKAVTWHLRSSSGGIRSYESQFLWDHDERIFARKLTEWGVVPKPSKLIVLNCGLGDHFAFKHVLPEIMEKYKNHDLLLAVCFPDIFEGIDVNLISIADAQLIGADTDQHNVYVWMAKNNWTKSLSEAYREFLL